MHTTTALVVVGSSRSPFFSVRAQEKPGSTLASMAPHTVLPGTALLDACLFLQPARVASSANRGEAMTGRQGLYPLAPRGSFRPNMAYTSTAQQQTAQGQTEKQTTAEQQTAANNSTTYYILLSRG